MKKIIAVTAIVLSITLFSGRGNVAHAAISAGSVTCNAPSDCVVSATGDRYNVSFVTNTSATASVIQVTFPNSYNLNNTAVGVSNVFINGVDNGTPGTNNFLNTVNIILHTPANLSTGTVTFSLTGGPQFVNPSSTGTTSAFTINTDAAGETSQTNVPGVVITPAPTVPPLVSLPAASTSYVDGNNFNLQYTLPQTPAAGSIHVTFTPTPSGTPITLTLANATAGVQTLVSFSPQSITPSSQIIATSAGSIPDGTYNVTFSYQNSLGGTAGSTTISAVSIIPTAPPTVSTVTPLTEIGQTTATLKGSLTSGGGTVVTTGFRYGTNPDPSSYAYFPFLDENYVGTPILFIGPVVGLSCGTTYYYQAYAMNTAAIVTGNLESFRTLDCSPVASPSSSGQLSGGNSSIIWTPQTGFVSRDAAPVAVSVASGSAAPVKKSPSITATLKLGMNNSQVKLLQEYLNSHGFTIAAKGKGSAGNENTSFGAATKAAVIKFEKAHGLVPDGIVGQNVLALINQ